VIAAAALLDAAAKTPASQHQYQENLEAAKQQQEVARPITVHI